MREAALQGWARGEGDRREAAHSWLPEEEKDMGLRVCRYIYGVGDLAGR
jgi:hypothetical protein